MVCNIRKQRKKENGRGERLKTQVVKIEGETKLFVFRKPVSDEVIRGYRFFRGEMITYDKMKESELYEFYYFKKVNVERNDNCTGH